MKILKIDKTVDTGNVDPIPLDKAEKLVWKIPDIGSYELIFININYKCEDGLYTDNEGIRFLKMLRLMHINTHCVLYSFLSREQLLKLDPLNLILFSPGVSFARIPEDIKPKNIDLNNYTKKIEEKAPEDLSNYFRAETGIFTESHSISNWWGIILMWEFCNQIKPTINDHELYEYMSEKAYEISRNYQGLLEKYLWHKSPITNIQEEKINKINNIISNIKRKNASFLLIDDQAKDGWDMILNILFFGYKYTNFSKSVLDYSINKDWDNIKKRIEEKNPSIIFLDLYFEGDSKSNPTGLNILENINKSFTIPVIIFSASTKIINYKKAISLGALAYWIKPNLTNPFNDTVFNHIVELIDIVHHILHHDNVQIYLKLLEDYKYISTNKKQLWCATPEWHNYKTKHNISGNIGSKRILKNYKEAKEISKFSDQNKDISFFNGLSLIVFKLFEIIEIIFINESEKPLRGCIISAFGENIHLKYTNIISMRNQVMHGSNPKKIEEYITFIDSIKDFLFDEDIKTIIELKNNSIN